MISYTPNVHQVGQYVLSYSSLRESYLHYATLPDEQFVADVLGILHFACFVCFVKEAKSERVLADDGIIHELVHLLDPETRDDAVKRLKNIRATFSRDCCLA
jgi:hypothetical protein